jgi:pimeloyl-ACP methyl ester carboxylesterase
MLHVYRAGGGEPLVLIHGLGAHWRFWEPVLPMLEPHHDVLVPDLPGFGQSRPLPSRLPDNVHELVDALETAMDGAGFGTAHIAGHSFGGLLALELGLRGRARTVCAISPAGMVHGWEHYYVVAILETFRKIARALYPALPLLARSAVIRTLLLWPLASRPWRMDPKWIESLARGYADTEAFITLKASAWDHVTEKFCDIACPAVIGWGSRDWLLFPRQGLRYAKVIPSVRLVRLYGIGHSATSDDPPMVADLILRTTHLVSIATGSPVKPSENLGMRVRSHQEPCSQEPVAAFVPAVDEPADRGEIFDGDDQTKTQKRTPLD